MKKNECAQEMILDLVMRHGCEVSIRPVAGNGKAVQIIIRHREVSAGTVIDLEQIGRDGGRAEEIVCRAIERTAMAAFRHPYREMLKKHFDEEA
jgi:hypothetical protein